VGVVDTFVRLFRGRADAYGTWRGGSVHEKLTKDHFERHLYSHNPRDWIGVYNVVDNRCSWGCVDIDTDDLPLAYNIRAALGMRNIPAWVERTTRGYHVWVFPHDQLVDASVMRRALTAACKAVQYDPKEVFPKQTKATGGMLGNYVRLPLNGSQANPAPGDCRRFIHEGVTLLDMDQWRATTDDLTATAALVRTTQDVDNPVDIQMGLEVAPEVARIGGVVARIWSEGPKYGHDRSSTLARLAHELHERDVDRGLALQIVAAADDRWGKGFAQRGESGVRVLNKIIENAWRRG
jgi:hypothetical protein